MFVRVTCAGSLLVIVLLKTAHYNLAKLKDVYLHTNTLAALANLAPHVSHLSSHASQRLVSLFDMLARRCPLPCMAVLVSLLEPEAAVFTSLYSTLVWDQ